MFLRYYLVPYWSVGNIKVVLVLRNQIDYFASLYSQMSHGIVDAGQLNFERQAFDVARNRNHLMDWRAFVEELQEVLGSKNVHVSFFEDLFSNEQSQRELVSFACGGSSFLLTEKEQREAFGEKLNKKNITSGVWSISEYDRNSCTEGRASFRLKSLCCQLCCKWKAKAYGRNRSDSIVVSSQVRDEFMKYFEESNMALSSLLHKVSGPA